MPPRNTIIKNLFKLLYRFQQNYYARYLLVIFSMVGGYLALIASDSSASHNFHTFCFFKLATGIPCPGCGMGRATLALLHGNIALSLSYNLLCVPFSLAILGGFCWSVIDMIHHKDSFYRFVRRDISLNSKLLLFGLLLVDWVVNIIRLKN